MPAGTNAPLSTNQKAMLDLALSCHLKIAPSSAQPAIRARHLAIKTQAQAAQYISEVETQIHSRRKFTQPRPSLPVSLKAALAPKPTFLQTSAGLAVVILGLVVLMVAAGFLPNGWNLVLIVIAMVAVLLAIGFGVTHSCLGVLINERNLMSLSRFQMAVWTVVVLSAYFTFALVRIKAGNVDDPLAVAIDWHLWALLGISTTSLVGTPLFLNTKKDETPDPGVVKKTAALTDESAGDVSANRQGILYANTSMNDACFTDMFEGDEIGNTMHVDLAKVQMFYFTIIAAVAVFVMTFKAVISGAPLRNPAQLPILPDGLVAILGISHAGYLTSKGTSHTKTQS